MKTPAPADTGPAEWSLIEVAEPDDGGSAAGGSDLEIHLRGAVYSPPMRRSHRMARAGTLTDAEDDWLGCSPPICSPPVPSNVLGAQQ